MTRKKKSYAAEIIGLILGAVLGYIVVEIFKLQSQVFAMIAAVLLVVALCIWLTLFKIDSIALI